MIQCDVLSLERSNLLLRSVLNFKFYSLEVNTRGFFNSKNRNPKLLFSIFEFQICVLNYDVHDVCEIFHGEWCTEHDSNDAEPI